MNKNLLIKVCGVRSSKYVRSVSSLGVDLVDFDFRSDSPRFIRMISAHSGLLPDYSAERLRRLRSSSPLVEDASRRLAARVGVFSDAMPQDVVTRAFNYRLDYLQLSGEEPRTTCENLRRTLDPDVCRGVRIIKSLRVSCAADFSRCAEYGDAVDLFLFLLPRGAGSLEVGLLDAYEGAVPFLVGGDVFPADAACLAGLSHPLFAGVDLGARFECSLGVPDVDLLRGFVGLLRSE